MAQAAQTPSTTDTWDLIHDSRHRVGELLATLTDEEWNRPSLCAGWRVRDVAAHNVETHLMTPGRFMAQFAGTGFRFNAMTAKGVAGHRDQTPAQILEQFRQTADRNTAPPGPLIAMLGEAVIHGGDIAHPLRKQLAFSPAALSACAAYVSRTSALLHGKQRGAGLTLTATDVDWTSGSGPLLSGPALSLILALTGRRPAAEDLSGEGVATLQSRLS